MWLEGRIYGHRVAMTKTVVLLEPVYDLCSFGIFGKQPFSFRLLVEIIRCFASFGMNIIDVGLECHVCSINE